MTELTIVQTATSREASKEYGISMVTGILCFVTAYMIGQALGGIVLAPISEIFGRRTIYIIGTTVFGIASVIAGVPYHLAAATIGRFFQGVAAAIPATVAFGNFNDMYDADTRVWVVYWYTLAGMAGLALGPIYSSYVTDLLGW
jgi:MFS family permease